MGEITFIAVSTEVPTGLTVCSGEVRQEFETDLLKCKERMNKDKDPPPDLLNLIPIRYKRTVDKQGQTVHKGKAVVKKRKQPIRQTNKQTYRQTQIKHIEKYYIYTLR